MQETQPNNRDNSRQFMKPYYILILLAILLLFIQSGVSAQGDYLIAMNPNGPTHLRVGESCTVTLSEREFPQGFKWAYFFSDFNKIVKVSEKETKGGRSFVFKVIEAGSVRVDLVIFNPQIGKSSTRQKKEFWLSIPVKYYGKIVFE